MGAGGYLCRPTKGVELHCDDCQQPYAVWFAPSPNLELRHGRRELQRRSWWDVMPTLLYAPRRSSRRCANGMGSATRKSIHASCR